MDKIEQEYKDIWSRYVAQLKKLQVCVASYEDWQEIENIVNRLNNIINSNAKVHAIEETYDFKGENRVSK